MKTAQEWMREFCSTIYADGCTDDKDVLEVIRGIREECAAVAAHLSENELHDLGFRAGALATSIALSALE